MKLLRSRRQKFAMAALLLMPLAPCAHGQLVPGLANAAVMPAHGKPIASFEDSLPDEVALHVVTGHSVFINTNLRLARVLVANPAVLTSYTANPHQILCTAKEAGLSSIIVWDELGATQTYMVSSDIDVAPLRRELKSALPREPIVVQAEESKIVLTGTVSTDAIADAAVKLAAIYSKDVSNAMVVNAAAVKQVRLKVRIVEVDRSKLEQFGFNLFYAGSKVIGASSTTPFMSSLTTTTGSSAGSSSNTSTAGVTSNVLGSAANFLFYLTQYDIGASIQDLESKQVLQILAEPTIMTLSGQKANFLAGGEFPFPVVQGSTGGLTSVTIQFRSYGVKLEFTPLVNPDGTIALKVAPEVSALDYTNAVQISGYTIPALSTRRAETQVVLNSGQSFAISGLLDKRTTDSYSKTPGISSIPILGELFKSKNVNHSNSELVVIVTPTTVDPLTETVAVFEPKTVIQTLDPPKFDKSLPKSAVNGAERQP